MDSEGGGRGGHLLSLDAFGGGLNPPSSRDLYGLEGGPGGGAHGDSHRASLDSFDLELSPREPLRDPSSRGPLAAPAHAHAHAQQGQGQGPLPPAVLPLAVGAPPGGKDGGGGGGDRGGGDDDADFVSHENYF
jgi:hypothetical protein